MNKNNWYLSYNENFCYISLKKYRLIFKLLSERRKLQKLKRGESSMMKGGWWNSVRSEGGRKGGLDGEGERIEVVGWFLRA